MKWFFFLLFLTGTLLLPLSAQARSMTVEEKYPQSIDEMTLSGLVSERIEQALADAGETRRHTIDVVRVPRGMHVPAGEVQYDVSLPNGLRFGGMMAVNVAVQVDGVPFRQFVCSARVHIYESVAVAARILAPEQLITSADFRMEERELENSRDRYFTRAEDVNGHVPNRLIREGTLLTAAMLRNPVIFTPGAQVYILVRLNGVEVRTEGVALQSGRVDALIRVRNVNSGKVLRARVVDVSTVEVLQSDMG